MSDVFTESHYIGTLVYHGNFGDGELAKATKAIRGSVHENLKVSCLFVRKCAQSEDDFQAFLDSLDVRHKMLQKKGMLHKARDFFDLERLNNERRFPIGMWDSLFGAMTPETTVQIDEEDLKHILRAKKSFQLHLKLQRDWSFDRNFDRNTQLNEKDKLLRHVQTINRSHASSLTIMITTDTHALYPVIYMLDAIHSNSKLNSLMLGVEFKANWAQCCVDSKKVIKNFWRALEHFVASTKISCFKLYFIGQEMANRERMISCSELVQGMSSTSFLRALRNNKFLHDFDVLTGDQVYLKATSVGIGVRPEEPRWKKIQDCVGRTLESESLELESKLRSESLDKVIYEAGKYFTDAAILELVPKFVEDAKFLEAQMKAAKRRATKTVLEKFLRRKKLYLDSVETLLQTLIESRWCPLKPVGDTRLAHESSQKAMVAAFISSGLLHNRFRPFGVDDDNWMVERSTQTEDFACSSPSTLCDASCDSKSGPTAVEEGDVRDVALMVEHSMQTEDDAYCSPDVLSSSFVGSGIGLPDASATDNDDSKSCILEDAFDNFVFDTDAELSDCSLEVVAEAAAIDSQITKGSKESPLVVFQAGRLNSLETSPMSTAVPSLVEVVAEGAAIDSPITESSKEPPLASFQAGQLKQLKTSPMSTTVPYEAACKEKLCFSCVII